MKNALMLMLLVAFACGDDDMTGGDAGADGGPVVDSGAADAGPADDTGPEDAQVDAMEPDVAAVYAPDRLLEVDIQLPAESWETLRNQSRSLVETLRGDCLDGPFDQPFSWFEGSVTIDGEFFERVDVRKKGFIGSLSTSRPGIKLDLGEYVDDQRYSGVRRFTFNNSVSDPSVVRQCLGYALFAQAGVPAPRCNFAHVTVNGEDLGVYVNIEALKGDFLEASFGTRDGNFYEGTLSDFTPEMSATFEPKNNEEVVERTDIMPVVDALALGDDASVLAALEAVVDIDAYLTFWAMETLTEHTDGYHANRNNFYVYFDEDDGLMRFVPWGIDSILAGATVAQGLDDSVYTRAALGYRLYAIPSIRARYFTRLDELLASVWDEDAIDAEILRMRDMVRPFAEGEALARMTRSTDELRSAVVGRRAEIEAARRDGDPDVGAPEGPLRCFTDRGQITGTFATTWGTLDRMDFTGAGSLEVTIDGEVIPFNSAGSAAGTNDQGPAVLLFGVQSGGLTYIISAGPPIGLIMPGILNLDLIGITGFIGTIRGGGPFQLIGFVGGEIEFTQAGTNDGDRIVGSMNGTIYVGL